MLLIKVGLVAYEVDPSRTDNVTSAVSAATTAVTADHPDHHLATPARIEGSR
jgi:hypothetical protein